MFFKDKTINILSIITIIVLYISAVANNDLTICVLANQLLIILLLLKIICDESRLGG